LLQRGGIRAESTAGETNVHHESGNSSDHYFLFRIPKDPGKTRGELLPIRDAQGDVIPRKRRVVEQYFPKPERWKLPFGVWVTYSSWGWAGGSVEFAPEGSGCRVTLDYHFGATGVAWFLFIPFDTDPDSFGSNGRLEEEYLAELERMLKAM
jgi:hypothetical protein